jgi:hypothetical protein
MACVWALNALQNSMMLRPRWPRAGPIGRRGVRLAGGNLQLDQADDLLGHVFLLCNRGGGPRLVSANAAEWLPWLLMPV